MKVKDLKNFPKFEKGSNGIVPEKIQRTTPYKVIEEIGELEIPKETIDKKLLTDLLNEFMVEQLNLKCIWDNVVKEIIEAHKKGKLTNKS